VYRPAAKSTGCTRCGACAAYCSAGAISLGDQGPEFDPPACIGCAGCTEKCPEGVIYIREKGYKVVAGGCGARRPHIADTVAEFTDGAGVLAILEKAVLLLRDTPTGGRFISLREALNTTGAEKLKP
jgi:dissimilatory sulfite reductase (desulfoviridin) alpha/beta subunit